MPGLGVGIGAGVGAGNQIPLPSSENWWERRVPANMRHVANTAEFVEALGAAGDKLVVVDFFGTWCRSCRAMHPKLCMLAFKNPDVIFLQVEFGRNKQLFPVPLFSATHLPTSPYTSPFSPPPFSSLCMLASRHPDVIFLQVEFDPNKQLCRSLGIKRLPFFHFYRGADGLLDAFPATLTSSADGLLDAGTSCPVTLTSVPRAGSIL
ncbi:unnamed protein product [Closterium sp. NIES-65]|nr:unnamed protein product [Closterium sp. NIES-65]CAI5999463.1 unnamed protein product [Closterium sp. NIES-65]